MQGSWDTVLPERNYLESFFKNPHFWTIYGSNDPNSVRLGGGFGMCICKTVPG